MTDREIAERVLRERKRLGHGSPNDEWVPLTAEWMDALVRAGRLEEAKAFVRFVETPCSTAYEYAHTRLRELEAQDD